MCSRAADLAPSVQDRALRVFRRIAVAEGRVHGCEPEEIHFHEVGAVDTIVDVCGACFALERLGVERVFSSPPVTGTGSHAPRGGVVATAGGLLFVGTSSDRKFRAYDSDTGTVLWSRDLPAAQEGVPAVYSVGGREYVAIAVGGNGLFTQSMQLPEAGPGQYMVFALGETPK